MKKIALAGLAALVFGAAAFSTGASALTGAPGVAAPSGGAVLAEMTEHKKSKNNSRMMNEKNDSTMTNDKKGGM